MKISQPHPGIFVFKLFTRGQCDNWRRLIDGQRDPEIKGPNTMNRYGVNLGGSLRPHLSNLVINTVEHFALNFYGLGPLKKNPYAFAVDYSPGTQRSLKAHYDQSDVTLNVCLGTVFDGGELVFDGKGRERIVIEHKVGQAIVHLGSRVHRAKPVTAGNRTNLILWCAAKKGQR